MTLHRARQLPLVAGLGTLAVASCLVAAPGGPGAASLAAGELLTLALLAIWGVHVARDLAQGAMLAGQLTRGAIPAEVAGVDCRVVPGGGRRAFVLGAVRPRIYLGDALLASLDREELRAVVWHEEHHRRTRAPLRSAAIAGLVGLIGGRQRVRQSLLERLADLEVAADDETMRRGANAATLASALLKCDPAPAAAETAFTAAGDRRLRVLLARAEGASVASGRLPYEWLPPLLALAALVALAAPAACRVLGLI